jgi:peptide-methionine (R)-S-oxide reductase
MMKFPDSFRTITRASHGKVATVILFLLLLSTFQCIIAFRAAPVLPTKTTSRTLSFRSLSIPPNNNNNNDNDGVWFGSRNQRPVTRKEGAAAIFGVTGILMTMLFLNRPAQASASRTDGYKIQKNEEEWRSMLSDIQYQILRKGGTERPGFSVLLEEKRPGIFRCAGCGASLFSSSDKFNSGTGWPSFARSLENVEIEAKNPVVASLSGAELRCGDCGGHLGDVFQDGYLFLGTEAAVTGQRFCIDGVALVFYPENGDPPTRGDQPIKRGGGIFG